MIAAAPCCVPPSPACAPPADGFDLARRLLALTACASSPWWSPYPDFRRTSRRLVSGLGASCRSSLWVVSHASLMALASFRQTGPCWPVRSATASSFCLNRSLLRSLRPAIVVPPGRSAFLQPSAWAVKHSSQLKVLAVNRLDGQAWPVGTY
jgi:hypothetical protein